MTPRESTSSIALIFALCLLSFGLQLPGLGFYWDDYASLYVYQKYGSEVFTDWTSGQGRPLGGFLIGQLWGLIGVDALPWHLLNFVLYVASVLLFWGILRSLLPKYPAQTTLTALLFAVYPSYHLRPIPISFSLIASLVLLLLSFWLMLMAVRQKSHALNILAAIFIPLNLLIYEQNFGYEILRPLLIGIVLFSGATDWRNHWREILPYWIPHMVAVFVFIMYRGFIFQPNETYASYNTPSNLKSLDGLLLTFKRSVAAPTQMIAVDWFQIPWRLFVTESSDVDIPGVLAILVLLLCLLYLWRFPQSNELGREWVLATTILSFVMISALLLSVHLVGRVLEVGFNSRWALSPSLMAAVFLGLGLPSLLRSSHLGQIVLVILVTLGVAVQVGVNQEYADDWALRRDLWWQIRWRAPLMEPNTLLIFVDDSGELAFSRSMNDYELAGHSNLFYDVDTYPLLGAGEARLLENILIQDKAQSGSWSEATSRKDVIFRDWEFDLDQVVVFGYNGGCLLTADPLTHAQVMNHQDFLNLAPLHNAASILDQGLDDFVPYQKVVEPEPPRNWCFYYQQTQWSLQYGYNPAAAAMADAVVQQGLNPIKGHEVEWLPFIEAYNMMGQYDDAKRLVYRVAFASEEAQSYLCERLKLQSDVQQDQLDLLGVCSP
jgi:hypothetical protein